MKMYKRIFGVLLCLCILLGAVSLASATEDGGTAGGSQTGSGTTHENHPICGATHTDIGDHTSPCAPITTWTKLYMKNDVLYYGDNQLVTDDTGYNHYTLGSGNYYLDTDVTVTKVIKITGNVTICLNGHDLTQASTVSNLTELLDVGSGSDSATLNICNCDPAKGCIDLTKTESSTSGYNTIRVYGSCTLNLFSGKISRENGQQESCTVKLDSGNYVKDAVFNMYGGEVSNIGSETSYAAVRTDGSYGLYSINIYGGDIHAVRNGIDTRYGKTKAVCIAGGSISGTIGSAVYLGDAALTLSGSPALNGSDADIMLYSNTSFTVTDDFEPATKVSVAKSDYGVFAKPAAGKSLAGKTDYFVSAETGYCVTTTTDGNLQLTPCQITQQPTAANAAVAASGNPTYQWYRTIRGDVPVTDKNATDKGNYYWNGEWSIEDRNSAYISDQSIFSIDMKEGDTLTLSCENSSQGSITGVNLYNSNNIEEVGEKETVMGTSGETIYKFTVPADGDYTLRLSARGFSMEEMEWTSLSFTATVTGDVPDTTQALNKGDTLNTSKLCKGTYICRVTWQGKTDKGATTIIDSNPVTLNKEHTGAAATRENENPATCTADGSYDEVVKCSRCGAEISRTSKTIPAKGHDWGEWTVTKEATTTAEGEKQRVCKNNAAHVDTQSLPKLTPRYYYNSTTTTTKDTTKKDNTKSPGTFDPGVGVYALTAVLSVTGMAWVGRKKH